MSTFVCQLKIERTRRGWSQARLATELGTDTKTASRWERGVTTSVSQLREKLLLLFGKTTQELGLVAQEEVVPALLDPVIPLPLSFPLIGRDEERAQELLRLMMPEESEDVQDLLEYEENSAGGLMTTDCIEINASRTFAEVMAKYNLLAVPVINATGILEGVITVDDALDVLLPNARRRKPRRMY
jgi:transcriptional regulator with XRE-family HTH domain